MKILIFGVNGMLGHKLFQQLRPKFDVNATIRGSFESIERFPFFERERTLEYVDAANIDTVEDAIRKTRPDVVINAIGIIKQVASSKNVVTALTINSIFPHRLAELGKRHDFRTITVSTDCVFDGEMGNYSEQDVPNAVDLYGKSKNLGELDEPNCLTIRSSIIGRELESHHSLLEWVLSNRGKQIGGFTNAIYSGFPTIVFADIIGTLISEHRELSGLYHIASAPINKFELLNLINKYYEAGIDIVPSDEFRIDRSLDATKFNELTGYEPPSWDELVRIMAADPTPYEQFRK